MKAVHTTFAVLAAATLLAACGGGDEGIFVDEKDPSPSGLSVAITVSGATGSDLPFNGVYSTNNLSLNNVTRVDPVDAPETCRFKFSELPQAGNASRRMDGDIRYIPDSAALNVTFVSIDAVEYRLQGSAGAAVDRANNRVVYTNAVLTSTQGTGRTITLNGFIPMRGDRPGSC